MLKIHLARIVLIAILFCTVFQLLGVAFHGQVWPDGLIFATLFTMIDISIVKLILWASRSSSKITAVAKITIPVLTISLFFAAAIELIALAQLFPQQFTITHWWSAICAGLLIWCVDVITYKLKAT